ncbi:ABC transporter [Streptomyces siamensis]|uniref:ABC transporter n=1 Tax=Streptomyces siamensis TaxID=1274986 RepID=A0ABP9ISN0_9ACTN
MRGLGTAPAAGPAPSPGGGAPPPAGTTPGAGPYAVAGALLPPLWRALPRSALTTGAVLALLLVALPRLLSTEPDPWLSLNLLRAAALTLGLGLAFLLDDPARHTTAPVPTRRPVRAGLRVALVAPLVALCWTAALLLTPARVRPPVGAVTLEAGALALLALAAASVAVRCTDAAEPGVVVSAGLLGTVCAAALLLPYRWTLFPSAGDPAWGDAHQRWAWLLAGAAVTVAYAGTEPVRRRRVLRTRSGT